MSEPAPGESTDSAPNNLKTMIVSMADPRLPSKTYVNRVARVLRLSPHDNTPLAIMFARYTEKLYETELLNNKVHELHALTEKLRDRMRYIERRILRAERSLWNVAQGARQNDEHARYRAEQQVTREFEQQKFALLELRLAEAKLRAARPNLVRLRDQLIALQEDMDTWLDERELEMHDVSSSVETEVIAATGELAFIESTLEKLAETPDFLPLPLAEE